MKILKFCNNETLFPYVAYIPDKISENPALIVQLHGAGERGNGETVFEAVTRHGFAKIVNDENLADAILVMPQCPQNSFWVAKIEKNRITTH